MRAPPTNVIAVFTTLCNYRCAFCSQHLPNKQMRHWSYEDITTRLDELWDHSRISNIGGCGEVTILPFFDRLMDYFDSKSGYVCFSTNGYAIHPDSLRKRRLDHIVVSLHSLVPETYDYLTGTSGRLPRVLENLRILAAKPRNFRVIVVSVVTAKNVRESPALARFALEIGADEMRFLPLADAKVVGLGTYAADLIPDAEESATLTSEANQIMRGSGGHARPILSTEAVKETVATKMKTCGCPTQQIVIGPEGRVQPCCYIPDWCGFGNILEAPWQAVWNGEKYEQFRSEVRAGTCHWCFDYCRNWG